MTTLSEQERETFLREPRYGMLSTLRADGSPITVPVWYHWDGTTIRMFASADSPKMKRINADPRISLLVSNNLDEHEVWVAFDGTVTIKDSGGFALAEKLSTSYWDMNDPKRRATLETWREATEDFCLLEMVPEKIRTYNY